MGSGVSAGLETQIPASVSKPGKQEGWPGADWGI
jgi:hypothetical protein